MATRLLQFSLGGGEVIHVEVEAPPPAAGVFRGAPPPRVIEDTHKAFDAALGKIRPVAESLVGHLRGMLHAPEEIEVEFGVKMDAEAGVVLARCGMEANLVLTLTWRKTE
ncbi:MAG: hypothetical protein K6T75_00460 [Acetobacteraceae bacterium]|nr:hypothetical protein [Acetobacteraceae bacterium]